MALKSFFEFFFPGYFFPRYQLFFVLLANHFFVEMYGDFVRF